MPWFCNHLAKLLQKDSTKKSKHRIGWQDMLIFCNHLAKVATKDGTKKSKHRIACIVANKKSHFQPSGRKHG
jgi:hypothetical protein